MSIQTWRIAVRPEGKYEPAPVADDDDGQAEGEAEAINMGGMIVFLVHGGSRVEIARVGFVRRNTQNPDAEFGEKLREVVDTAREAVKMIQDLTTTQEGLQ